MKRVLNMHNLIFLLVQASYGRRPFRNSKGRVTPSHPGLSTGLTKVASPVTASHVFRSFTEACRLFDIFLYRIKALLELKISTGWDRALNHHRLGKPLSVFGRTRVLPTSTHRTLFPSDNSARTAPQNAPICRCFPQTRMPQWHTNSVSISPAHRTNTSPPKPLEPLDTRSPKRIGIPLQRWTKRELDEVITVLT